MPILQGIAKRKANACRFFMSSMFLRLHCPMPFTSFCEGLMMMAVGIKEKQMVSSVF